MYVCTGVLSTYVLDRFTLYAYIIVQSGLCNSKQYLDIYTISCSPYKITNLKISRHIWSNILQHNKMIAGTVSPAPYWLISLFLNVLYCNDSLKVTVYPYETSFYIY